MNAFYQAALHIAERKLFRDSEPTKLASPRLGTGGKFVDIFLWDTAFSTFWARYHADRFPVAESLDNFYHCQTPEGFISRQICPNGISKWAADSTIGFAPPLLAWAELELEPYVPGRLAKVFEPLLRQHRFNLEHFRRPDGLFFSDCWGCGMDNLPRWDSRSEVVCAGGIPFTRHAITAPGEAGDALFEWMNSQSEMPFFWNRQLGWCDTSCQMAFNALNLAEIARRLGRTPEERELRAQHRQIADTVNALCFNEKTGFYSDFLNGHPLARRTIAAFGRCLPKLPRRNVRQNLSRHCAILPVSGVPAAYRHCQPTIQITARKAAMRAVPHGLTPTIWYWLDCENTEKQSWRARLPSVFTGQRKRFGRRPARFGRIIPPINVIGRRNIPVGIFADGLR